MIDNTKRDMKIQMDAFEKYLNTDVLENNYEKYIIQSENANSDFLIYNTKTHKLMKNRDVFFDIQNIPILHDKSLYTREDETVLILYKNIGEYTLILKRDIYYDIDDLKAAIARWIEVIRFEGDNYFWIHTNTNRLVAHPYRKDEIGTDDTKQQDAQGLYFVQHSVRMAIKNNEGVFIEFFYPKLEEKLNSKKLSFVKLYKDWNWVIGTGIYIDEIQKVISSKKQLLEKKMRTYIGATIVITTLLILVILVISILFSQQINKTFKDYQDKVNKKEATLKDLNQNLHKKIELAIKEAKEKDRAMLHQSRLARMGEMLSMISHQWRQPLSQLAGIMMEVETSVAFKKASDKFILNCTKDATNIIQFMALTIEDFKNFFKPEKDKEEFYISEACKGASSLIKDSLINQNIILNITLIKDKKIRAYKREYAQVILNLLVNAKDALLTNNIKNGKINLCIDDQDDCSIVTVQDNAGGIKEEHLELVFEPYFSTKKSQGTGLGLYMSKMIIEKNMQGKISVKNHKDGALFKVAL